MKFKKLLPIKLVAPKYIVVEEDGQNKSIEMSDTSMYHVGNMFELICPIEENKISSTDSVVESKVEAEPLIEAEPELLVEAEEASSEEHQEKNVSTE